MHNMCPRRWGQARAMQSKVSGLPELLQTLPNPGEISQVHRGNRTYNAGEKQRTSERCSQQGQQKPHEGPHGGGASGHVGGRAGDLQNDHPEAVAGTLRG